MSDQPIPPPPVPVDAPNNTQAPPSTLPSHPPGFTPNTMGSFPPMIGKHQVRPMPYFGPNPALPGAVTRPPPGAFMSRPSGAAVPGAPPGAFPPVFPGSLVDSQAGALPGASLRGNFSKQIYCEIHFPEKLMPDGQCSTCTLKRRQEEEQKEIISIYNKLLEEERKSKQEKGEEEEKNGQERAPPIEIQNLENAQKEAEEEEDVGFNDLRQSVIDLGKKIATRLMDIDSKENSYNDTEKLSMDYYDTLFNGLIELLQRKKNKYVGLLRDKLEKAQKEIKQDREKMAVVSKDYMETYKEYERVKSQRDKSENETQGLKGKLDKINGDLDLHNISMQNHSEVNFLPFQRPKEQLFEEMANFVDDLLRFEWRLKDSFQKMTIPQLHSFQWGSKNLHLYNIETKKLETRELSSQFQVPIYSRSVATEQGRLFLIGGYMPKEHYYLKNTFVYEEKRNNFSHRASMRYPRASHGILYHSGSIYVFGTFLFGACYKHCERYDVASNRWMLIAEMNVPRAGGAFCVFQKNFILCFGGRNKFESDVPPIDSIQVYNIKMNQWKYAPYDKESVWIPAYLAAAFQVSEREVLIFGGKAAFKNSQQQQILSNTYIYDVTSGKLTSGPSLHQPSFFTSLPVCVNREMWALTNEWKVHKYSVGQNKWEFINPDP